jgi:hypothetical protein
MSLIQTSTGLVDAVAGAVKALRGAVAGFEAGCLSGEDARRLAEVFAEGKRLCSAGMAMCATRVADCANWTSSGARSPEHWLAGISGSGVGGAPCAEARSEVDQAGHRHCPLGSISSQPRA